MCANQKKIGAIAGLALALASPAWAVNFNIDFGNGGGVFGPPPPGYPAAAGTPPGAIGVWNNVPGPAPFPLVNLDGLATAASVAVTAGANATFNSCKAGNDQRLLDDFLGLGGVGAIANVSIGPLPSGVYTVYTYAWSPNSPAHMTEVMIGGIPIPVGGPCTAWFAPWNFAMHVVPVPAGGGFINIQLRTLAGFGRLNGIQIRD